MNQLPPNLTEAEIALVKAVKDTGQAIGSGTRPEIRAEVIQAILLGMRNFSQRLISFSNFTINGDLNLSYTSIDCSWKSIDCLFSGEISADRLTLNSIEFSSCKFKKDIS